MAAQVQLVYASSNNYDSKEREVIDEDLESRMANVFAMLDDQDARIKHLEDENADLKAQVAQLNQKVDDFQVQADELAESNVELDKGIKQNEKTAKKIQSNQRLLGVAIALSGVSGIGGAAAAFAGAGMAVKVGLMSGSVVVGAAGTTIACKKSEGNP